MHSAGELPSLDSHLPSWYVISQMQLHDTNGELSQSLMQKQIRDVDAMLVWVRGDYQISMTVFGGDLYKKKKKKETKHYKIAVGWKLVHFSYRK